MEKAQEYIENVLKMYYKKLAKLQKETKEVNETIEIFESLKRGDYFDKLQ